PGPFVPHGYPGAGATGLSGPWWWIGIGIGALIAIVVAILRGNRENSAGQPLASRGRIRIIAVPPAEAPPEVRQAWLGLVLPFIAKGTDLGNQRALGVLSHRPTDVCKGYAVDGPTAIGLLAAEKPEAAAWWRARAPHILLPGYQLIFPEEVCALVSETQRGRELSGQMPSSNP